MYLIPSLNLSKTKISGAVAAAIISASISIIALGVLTYVRHMEPLKTWLVPYVPTSQYGGIFLYSNVIWGILWIGLFLALRRKQNVGNMRLWLLFFLVSLAVGTGFAEASLDWSQLSTIMSLDNVADTTSSETLEQTLNESVIKILEGSSVQGNLSYAPDTTYVKKDRVITWINDDSAPHTVTSGFGTDDPQSGKLFDSGSLGQGQKFSISTKQIETSGSFDYYCIVHPFMKGTITLE